MESRHKNSTTSINVSEGLSNQLVWDHNAFSRRDKGRCDASNCYCLHEFEKGKRRCNTCWFKQCACEGKESVQYGAEFTHLLARLGIVEKTSGSKQCVCRVGFGPARFWWIVVSLVHVAVSQNAGGPKRIDSVSIGILSPMACVALISPTCVDLPFAADVLGRVVLQNRKRRPISAQSPCRATLVERRKDPHPATLRVFCGLLGKSTASRNRARSNAFRSNRTTHND